MSTRQKKIIEILKQKNDWITGKELSSILGVSDRTIRNDIDQIGKGCKGMIESSVRYGYRINPEALAQSDLELRDAIPQTSEERCNYIIKKLLFDKTRLNILDLQYDIYVSEFTLKNDLKRLVKMLERFEGIELVRESNYLSLKGSEESKRKVYKELLADETNGNFINLNKIAQLFPTFNLIQVKNTLEKVLEKHSYQVREETFPQLMIHVGVAILRMMSYHYIDTAVNSSQIEGTHEYEIAKEFFGKVTAFLPFEVNESELALFASLLMGRSQGNVYMENTQNLYDAEALSGEIIEAIREKYGIDFSKDEVFKDGITLHIQNLLVRLNNRTPQSNVCLSEIKKNYPMVFEMSVFIGHIIEEYTKKTITEDELGFLAIHIGAAYDRLNIGYFYHAVLIQPNSQAMAAICRDKLMERFGDRMVIDAVLTYYEHPVIESLHPDLILTTLPLEHQMDVETVQISMFVSNNDEYKVFRALNELEAKRQKESFKEHIEGLIQEDYYFPDLECGTYEEVITLMCDKLCEGGRVPSEFKKSTFEREKMAYTSFSAGYALPHTLNYPALRSTIAIATLKKPVRWGDNEVRLVLLLAMRDDERELLRVFFDWFGNICDDSMLLSNIRKARNAKEFIRLVIE